MLDIKVITDCQAIPEELRGVVECSVPGNTYLLYKNKCLIGWGQVLYHKWQEHEIANVEVRKSYRGRGYGQRLMRYMVYHCPERKIFLTTISPQFYQRLGFRLLDHYPRFVDHRSTDCQLCTPQKCRALVFEKPPNWQRLRRSITDQATDDYTTEYLALLATSDTMICEFSRVNNLLWSLSENPYLVKIDDYLFLLTFPFESAGYGVILPYRHLPQATILRFTALLSKWSIKRIKLVTAVTKRRYNLADLGELHMDRDNYDYLYAVTDFATYPGRKFEKKRNRLSKFGRQYPHYQVLEYTPSLRREVTAFSRRIARDVLNLPGVYSYDILDIALQQELVAGLVVKIGERLVGILFYSELNRQTVVVHFEFIDPEYDGVAQLLNHELGKLLNGRYKYLNREQDLGLPGLRKSKLSYRPRHLLAKYDFVPRLGPGRATR